MGQDERGQAKPARPKRWRPDAGLRPARFLPIGLWLAGLLVSPTYGGSPVSDSRLTSFLGTGAAAAPRPLTYLRLESEASAIRVSLPAPLRWREMRLEHPPRFVLDLEPVVSRLPLAPSLYETRLALGPLRSVRTSQRPGLAGEHVVRVALEFARTVPCRVRLVGEELIVEFAGEGAPEQTQELTAAGWSTPATAAAATEPAAPAEPSGSAVSGASSEVEPLRAADRFFREGDWASADAAYRSCLGRLDEGIDPEDAAWVLFQLGNCHWIRGDAEEARALYERLAQTEPSSIWAPLARACLESR